jgi:predicted dehydrogenase
MKIGIIGAGGIFAMHMNQIKGSDLGLEVASVSDISAVRVEQTQAKYGIPKGYRDYKELIKNPEIDAVIICLPHHLHESVCTEAFAAGKHVLVEKPLARNCEEGERILEASVRAGKILMVGFNERYLPTHACIKQLMDDHAIGEVFSARTDHFQNFSPSPDSWWRSNQLVGGGCVIGSGIHRLDLLRWYLGEAREVYASTVNIPERLEAEALCSAIIRFKSGSVADFHCNWGVYDYPYYEMLGLYGRDGLILCDNCSVRMGQKEQDAGKLRNVETPPTVSMLDHFALCIMEGKVPLTNGYEGLKSLELVMAIYQSAAKRESVSL